MAPAGCFLLVLALCTAAPTVGPGAGGGDDVVRALALLERGEVGAARRILMPLQDTEEARAQQALARLHLAEGDTHAALRRAGSAIALEPSDADHHFWLGVVLTEHVHAVGRVARLAVARRLHAAFARAVELDPAHVEARLALIEFHRIAPGFAGGDPAVGARHAEELQERRPVAGGLALAAHFRERGDLRAAERAARGALAAAPGSAAALREIAAVQRAAGRHDAARLVLRSLLRRQPRCLEAAIDLARATLEDGGDRGEAARALEGALVPGPGAGPAQAEARALLASLVEPVRRPAGGEPPSLALAGRE